MPPSLFQTPTIQSLALTRELIARFGPRLAGSESCWQTARALGFKLKDSCGRAALESFTTHPAAFMGFYRIIVPVFIASVVFLNLNLPLLAGICCLFNAVSAGLEFGAYREFFDPIFPLKKCFNLRAQLEPDGAATQQVLITGHHDSAQELNFLRWGQKLYGLKIIVPDIIQYVGLIFSWLWVFYGLFTGQAPVFTPYVNAFLIFGILLVLPKFFLVSRRGTPGAGDNLIASAMLVELARLFARTDRVGKSSLRHTRLVFVSFDAEESGLRGSRAYARRHRADLQALPTYMLNIDSIYNVNELHFLTSDLNDSVALSTDLAQQCARLAARAGYPVRYARMVFGGGGTDAAELARVGVKATTLVAMSTSLVRDGLVYHTPKDIVDAIEPAAVEACLHIAHDLVLELDRAA